MSIFLIIYYTFLIGICVGAVCVHVCIYVCMCKCKPEADVQCVGSLFSILFAVLTESHQLSQSSQLTIIREPLSLPSKGLGEMQVSRHSGILCGCCSPHACAKAPLAVEPSLKLSLLKSHLSLLVSLTCLVLSCKI